MYAECAESFPHLSVALKHFLSNYGFMVWSNEEKKYFLDKKQPYFNQWVTILGCGQEGVTRENSLYDLNRWQSFTKEKVVCGGNNCKMLQIVSVACLTIFYKLRGMKFSLPDCSFSPTLEIASLFHKLIVKSQQL